MHEELALGHWLAQQRGRGRRAGLLYKTGYSSTLVELVIVLVAGLNKRNASSNDNHAGIHEEMKDKKQTNKRSEWR